MLSSSCPLYPSSVLHSRSAASSFFVVYTFTAGDWWISFCHQVGGSSRALGSIPASTELHTFVAKNEASRAGIASTVKRKTEANGI